MLLKQSISIELREKDELILTHFKNEKCYFGGWGSSLFPFFCFGVLFAVEILKGHFTDWSWLCTIVFKEKSKKMSLYIAEEYLEWILFKVKC